MTPRIVADSGWTPGNTLTLVGLVLTAAALVLSPLATRWVMRKAERERWERDRLTDAFASLMTTHAARSTWRADANHDHAPATHPVEVGVMPALLRLFGDLMAEKLALVALLAHNEYRAAIETYHRDVVARGPLTVPQAELTRLDRNAYAAEWAFYEHARKALKLKDSTEDFRIDDDRDGAQTTPVMGDSDRGPSQLGM